MQISILQIRLRNSTASSALLSGSIAQSVARLTAGPRVACSNPNCHITRGDWSRIHFYSHSTLSLIQEGVWQLLATVYAQILVKRLTLGMLNELRCHAHFKLSATIRFLDPVCWYKFTYWITNSGDPDQKKKPTDLILHCLQRQGISRFCRTRDLPGKSVRRLTD